MKRRKQRIGRVDQISPFLEVSREVAENSIKLVGRRGFCEVNGCLNPYSMGESTDSGLVPVGYRIVYDAVWRLSRRNWPARGEKNSFPFPGFFTKSGRALFAHMDCAPPKSSCASNSAVLVDGAAPKSRRALRRPARRARSARPSRAFRAAVYSRRPSVAPPSTRIVAPVM